MKIKVRIKHLKIKKCFGQEFIDSQLKGIDKYDKCDLIWSHFQDAKLVFVLAGK